MSGRSIRVAESADAAPEFPVEGFFAIRPRLGYERGSERGEACLDLRPRPLGPVAGALAGGSFAFESLGFIDEPRGSLEKRGVVCCVTLYDGRGPRSERGVPEDGWIAERLTLDAASRRPEPLEQAADGPLE